MTILVTGGAGYIGSHMVNMLIDAGHRVIALDILASGHRHAFSDKALFEEVDLSNAPSIGAVFNKYAVEAVMHFASLIEVAESVKDPAKYYRTNVANTLQLLEAMVKAEVTKFIFSSSAAVYGNPMEIPIREGHPLAPINPYGRSKWLVEMVLPDFEQAYGLKSVSLRYFNAAGADLTGRGGECHHPESHLIPRLLEAAVDNAKTVSIYGRDYDTLDGTCIRDFIHVHDLCQAHLLALNYLASSHKSTAFNLGVGNGHSVAEVVEAVRSITDRGVQTSDSPRRPGDPPRLVADASRAQTILGWRPKYSDLKTIIESAWIWKKNHPRGYEK